MSSPLRRALGFLDDEEPIGMSASALAPLLDRSVRRVAARLSELEARVATGEESAWPAFLEAAKALALLLPAQAPERHGSLLTTAEMAARLGITPKTLLRHKTKGTLRPALQRGKLIRWRGDEAPR
jgi:hypothetical protein